jgi:hypothetical protein
MASIQSMTSLYSQQMIVLTIDAVAKEETTVEVPEALHPLQVEAANLEVALEKLPWEEELVAHLRINI